MKIETLREIYVIELRINHDGKQSLQICGTSFSQESAEEKVARLPKPEGYEFSIVRYVPQENVAA
jgi:hypothetical protein